MSAMKLTWKTSPERTTSLMTLLTDMMRAVSSWTFPGREGWQLMFHVEHQKGLVSLWMWLEPLE